MEDGSTGREQWLEYEGVELDEEMGVAVRFLSFVLRRNGMSVSKFLVSNAIEKRMCVQGSKARKEQRGCRPPFFPI